MQRAKTFEDLIVWQKAHQLVLAIYKTTKQFPKSELYGLVDQMRRAAVSVPANIAEGFGKRKKPEKGRYLNIARGSLEEMRYYLILSNDLGYCETNDMINRCDEVARLLRMYHRRIEESM